MSILPSPFLHSGATPSAAPDEAPAPVPVLLGVGADISLIAEIFVGARKMFDPDPAAYTNEDQAYYDLLLQMDDPHTADLIDIPYGLAGIFDPPPLFLQMAV
jgi:hypothetical protein